MPGTELRSLQVRDCCPYLIGEKIETQNLFVQHYIAGLEFESRSDLLQSLLFTFLLHYTQPLRRRQWHPTPVLLPGKSHGWRSLVGCSPWGR